MKGNLLSDDDGDDNNNCILLCRCGCNSMIDRGMFDLIKLKNWISCTVFSRPDKLGTCKFLADQMFKGILALYDGPPHELHRIVDDFNIGPVYTRLCRHKVLPTWQSYADNLFTIPTTLQFSHWNKTLFHLPSETWMLGWCWSRALHWSLNSTRDYFRLHQE